MPARADVIGAVADALCSQPADRTLRVAVDGVTGSGKTTFARELADAVAARGRPTAHVTMDGFHNPRAIRYRQGRESAAGYYEDAYDFAALRRELLDPLDLGGSGTYRTAVLDLATDTPVDAPAQRAASGLVLIVDGSFLQKPEVRDAWDRAIYLRASFAAARERGATRDAAALGSKADALRLFDTRYHAAQRRYLAEVDPEATADVVIDHDDPAAPEIVRLAGPPA
jgi:uridine kinase